MRIRLRRARTAGFSLLLLVPLTILAISLSGSASSLPRLCAGVGATRLSDSMHLAFAALLAFGLAAFFLKRMRVVYTVALVIALALLIHQDVLRCSLA